MKNFIPFLLVILLTGCSQISQFYPQKDDQIIDQESKWQESEDQKIVKNKKQISQNAIMLLVPKCNEGEMSACNDAGANYEFLKQYENTAIYYEKACNGGVELGCANLGILYEHGLGVKKDPKRAVEIYRTSCNQGGARSCYNLANAYRKGEIVAQDYALAMSAYENACKKNDIPSCANIGAMYELGLGVEKDERRAYQIYKVACFRGFSKACPQMKRLGIKLGEINE